MLVCLGMDDTDLLLDGNTSVLLKERVSNNTVTNMSFFTAKLCGCVVSVSFVAY